MTVGPWRDLEDRRGRVEQHRENASRPGRAFAHYTTTGSGSLVERTVFDFGTSFTTLPIFTFGASLDEDADLPDGDPPIYTAGVYKWRKSANGFYTGAWCWFSVQAYAVADDFTLIFSLAWEGIASKDFISSHGFPVNTLDV